MVRGQGFELDYVLYSNYERQVEDLLDGRVDVAWNSPLAWVRARRLAESRGIDGVAAIAMRDTDCDLTSVVVVRDDSPVATIPDLAGKRVATGAIDSPQATLLPLRTCARRVDARGRLRRCAGSTSASACTATTSAASATPRVRWRR